MSNQLIFLLLVFAAVLFLTQTLFVSIYNPQRAKTKELKKQLRELAGEEGMHVNLLLNARVKKLSPIFARLEKIEFIENLTCNLEMSGSKMFGHQYLLLLLATLIVSIPIVWFYTFDLVFIIVWALIVIVFFWLRLKRAVNNRLEQIEMQFPESLDVLKRGLQAGYAFSEAIKLVVDETYGPLSDEFNVLFKQINFGADVKTALMTFVNRVPTTSAMAFVSAVSIQKETGGNLAEKIDGLSKVIRQRFKFKRRVKTLSAEGRLSAWVLVLTPFVLFAILYFSSPGYVSTLFESEQGIDLLKWGGVAMVVGIVWINKLINIEL
ncbi:type II secretion system F family protein [Thalassotalea aquiviva]|uniref:type II secretion system F family protein n=1 Tax=Thalassotalea aquiviva TaxID=3242415 RepID=UPI00352B7B5B